MRDMKRALCLLLFLSLALTGCAAAAPRFDLAAGEIAAAEDISVFEAMTTASHRTGIAAGKRMEEFCRMIAELQEAVSALPLDEFYDAVVERTGYALALETKGGDENVTRSSPAL